MRPTGPPVAEPRKDRPIERVMNVGPKTATWLKAVGVHTEADLHRLGYADVWRRLKARDPRQVSLNALYGLYGAVHGVKWSHIPEEVREALRAEVQAE